MLIPDDWRTGDYVPRRHPLPAPDTGIFDEPFACINLNLKWVSHLLGALEILDQHDSWTGDDTAIEAARQEVRRLMSTLNECMDMNAANVYDTEIGPGTLSPVLLGTFQAGETALSVRLAVDEAFEAGITITVGTDDDHELLMGAAENYPQLAEVYMNEPSYEFAVETAVYLYLSGAIVSGAARVYLTVEED